MREAINELRRSSGPDEGGLRHALRDDISMQSEEGREWSSICLYLPLSGALSASIWSSICLYLELYLHLGKLVEEL
jgi:hypothetical protein